MSRKRVRNEPTNSLPAMKDASLVHAVRTTAVATATVAGLTMMHVLLLYCSLADPVYETRESAMSQLTHLLDRHPQTTGPHLARWITSCTCPETRRRTLILLGRYDRWRANSFVPSAVPVWPICDAFPVACPVIPFGLEDVRDRCRWPVCGSLPSDVGGPVWTAYRRTTERHVRDLIRQGLSHGAADDLVARMWRLEQASHGDVDAVRWAVSGEWREWRGGYPRP